MTVGLLLSGLFVVLQLTGQIHWEWWQLVLPSLIEIGFYLLFWLLFLVGGVFAVFGGKR